MTVWLAALGARVLQWVTSLGHAAYFFADLVRFSPLALRRFGLVVSQVHAIGNRSLVIIMASGMAVGFVLPFLWGGLLSPLTLLALLGRSLLLRALLLLRLRPPLLLLRLSLLLALGIALDGRALLLLLLISL